MTLVPPVRRCRSSRRDSSYCSPLGSRGDANDNATLRRFADRIYWLFDTPKDVHQASCRRAAKTPAQSAANQWCEDVDRQNKPCDDGKNFS